MTANTGTEIHYLTPGRLAQALEHLVPIHRPLWIHGAPGVGKTSLVQQVAKKLGYECPSFPPAITLDPVDVRGVPYVTGTAERSTAWAPPNFWPRDPNWKGIIFVDELPQADKSVQSAFLQLTYGGRLGDYTVPKQATFVVCGNRPQDRAGSQKVITPLLSRFVHFGLALSLEEWQEWALKVGGLSPEIRGFLSWKPDHLDTFDPSRNQTSYACPRTWELADAVFKAGLPDDLLHAGIAGCVGAGPAAMFVGFVRIWGNLPNLDELLRNPTTATVPTDSSVLYALAGALAEKIHHKNKGVDHGLLQRFVTYIDRLPDEYSTFAMRDGIQYNPRLLPQAGPWLKKHKDVLLAK